MQQSAEGMTVNRRCGVVWDVCGLLWTNDGVVDEERGRRACGLKGVRAGEAFEPTRRAKPANEMVKRQ
jgi:hypothetical protein